MYFAWLFHSVVKAICGCADALHPDIIYCHPPPSPGSSRPLLHVEGGTQRPLVHTPDRQSRPA
jgi:hypothetical protein